MLPYPTWLSREAVVWSVCGLLQMRRRNGKQLLGSVQTGMAAAAGLAIPIWMSSLLPCAECTDCVFAAHPSQVSAFCKTAVSGSYEVCSWPRVSLCLLSSWNSELYCFFFATKFYIEPQLHGSLNPPFGVKLPSAKWILEKSVSISCIKMQFCFFPWSSFGPSSCQY